jgi:hypothetical protein
VCCLVATLLLPTVEDNENAALLCPPDRAPLSACHGTLVARCTAHVRLRFAAAAAANLRQASVCWRTCCAVALRCCARLLVASASCIANAVMCLVLHGGSCDNCADAAEHNCRRAHFSAHFRAGAVWHHDCVCACKPYWCSLLQGLRQGYVLGALTDMHCWTCQHYTAALLPRTRRPLPFWYRAVTAEQHRMMMMFVLFMRHVRSPWGLHQAKTMFRPASHAWRLHCRCAGPIASCYDIEVTAHSGGGVVC